MPAALVAGMSLAPHIHLSRLAGSRYRASS